MPVTNVNVNSEFIKGKKPDPTRKGVGSCRSKLAEILGSSRFMNVMALVIIVDACLTCADIDSRAESQTSNPTVKLMSDLCLYAYTAELLALLFLNGVYIFIKDWTVLLDALIVTCGYLETLLAAVVDDDEVVSKMSILRALRLVRIVRLMRLLRKTRSLKELQRLATMMSTCFKALVWSFLLCFVVMTLWAMLMVELIHPMIRELHEKEDLFMDCPACREATSSVMRANLLLFQTVIAGDSWGAIAVPVIEARPEAAIIFMGSQLILVFGVLNLIVAVVIDVFAEARERDMVNLAEELEHELEDDKKYLQKLFQRIDGNSDGELSFEELMNGASRDPEFQSRLRVMDIDQADLEMLFNMVDANGDGVIQPMEFIGPLSRWARDSKTAPRFVKYNLIKMQAQQEELFNLSEYYFRNLSDRIDSLVATMCTPSHPSVEIQGAAVGSVAADRDPFAKCDELVEPPLASMPILLATPGSGKESDEKDATVKPMEPTDVKLEALTQVLQRELLRSELSFRVATEDALNRSVAKMEGILQECARETHPAPPGISRNANRAHTTKLSRTSQKGSGSHNVQPWKDIKPGSSQLQSWKMEPGGGHLSAKGLEFPAQAI